jgi:hypothetical protein
MVCTASNLRSLKREIAGENAQCPEVQLLVNVGQLVLRNISFGRVEYQPKFSKVDSIGV